ncbi:MAG: hypothetical protein SA339_05130 [Methanomassiliicoccus sp.]|nr:hypothetical protein [Methanomassiliicoccus sp.]
MTFYMGRISLEDGDVKLQFWDYPNGQAMHVWPSPVEMLPGRAMESRQDLADRAQRAVNILSKFGGWQFGEPKFVGEFHHATNDSAIMGNFPVGFVPAKETGYWRDSTPGPDALETKDAARADAVTNFYGVTKELRASMASIRHDMASEKANVEGWMLENYRLLAEFGELQHRVLEFANLELQREAMTAMARQGATAQADQQPAVDNSGGMYQ